MHQQSPSDTAPRRWQSRAKLAAGTLALTMGALGAGLVATALPAYADVLSSFYTIGTPSGSVGTVTATPASVGGIRGDQLHAQVQLPSVHSPVQATPR